MRPPINGRRRAGRPPKSEASAEPRAGIQWRGGRAYGDFRPWEKWGGAQEPLKADGERFATDNPTTAAILFGKRLEELRATRLQYPDGLPTGDLDRLAAFTGYHLAKLAAIEGRKRPTQEYLDMLRTRLGHCAKFFAARGVSMLREISPALVADFVEYLRTFIPPVPERDRRGRRRQRRQKPLSRTTQRQYIDAFGHMLQRAVAEGRIARNLVWELVDRPTPEPSPTKHLELWECALLLEAARRLYPLHIPDVPPYYALLAFYLLTGCIESERKGVELDEVKLPGDPEFPRGIVIIRPNASRRRLKTIHRERIIPMHTQLGEILTEYLNGPNAPRAGVRLFDLGDWRKALDVIAAAAGFAAGEVRTRRFRVSYATHRLSTLDELGQPMTAWKLRGEMGHGTEQMIEQRYGRYARYRARRPVLEYRWDEWAERYGSRLREGLIASLTDGQRSTLDVLASHPEGLTAKEWEIAVGANPGTFYPQRDRLLQLELVRREGSQRGARFVAAR